MAYPDGYCKTIKPGQSPRRYAMRSLNFSSDNLAVQWQYVKRNLQELGIEDQAEIVPGTEHLIIEKVSLS